MKPLTGGFKDRTIDAGIRCRVYRNLNNGCFSVMAMEGTYRNKVVAHVDELILEPMESHPVNVVLAGGLLRARKEARRNVHAYLQGQVFIPHTQPELDFEITYYPFVDDNFKNKSSDLPIEKWDKHIYFNDGKAWMTT
ncbi:hypothetical protein ACPV5U_19635 [Vibrio mediterranei]